MRLAGTATALLLCTTANAAPFADEVTALPGWPSALPSKQYSGFLDVGSDYHLHYVFVEASGADPSTAPLVLCMQHPLDLHPLTERAGSPTPGSCTDRCSLSWTVLCRHCLANRVERWARRIFLRIWLPDRTGAVLCSIEECDCQPGFLGAPRGESEGLDYRCQRSLPRKPLERGVFLLRPCGG